MNTYADLILTGLIAVILVISMSISYYSWFYKPKRVHLEILRDKFPKIGKFLYFDMPGDIYSDKKTMLDVTLEEKSPILSFLISCFLFSLFYYLQIRNGYDFSDRNIIALNVLFFFIFLRALLIGQDLKRIVRAHKDAETAEALTSIPPEAADAKHKTDE